MQHRHKGKVYFTGFILMSLMLALPLVYFLSRDSHKVVATDSKTGTDQATINVGTSWTDTDGNTIQAHGGGFLQQTDTDGSPIYYWVGEDKSTNSANFNGVRLYSSKDLIHWQNRGQILKSDAVEGLKDCKIERPKLLYNAKSGKYVLWAHWEDASGYSSSQIMVATSDTVDGQYQFLGHWRPGADASHRNWRDLGNGDIHFEDGTKIDNVDDTSVWGYGSRDLTVFQDGDKAYLVSAENGLTMRFYELNDTYTDVDQSAMPSYELFTGGRREAPALVKSGQYYFMITSAQSGWYPNQTRYAYTKNLADPNGWSTTKGTDGGVLPSGLLGNNTTFYSQPTNIMTITGSATTSYIYMGDRWNPNALGDSQYIWLPISISGQNTDKPSMNLNYTSQWSFDAATGSVSDPNADQLLSQGKPATTDTAFATTGSYALSAANDGSYTSSTTTGDNSDYFKPLPQGTDVTNSETVAKTNATAPFTYTVDLTKKADLSRIDLSFRSYNGSECYYQYTVETSLDNEHWTTVADESDNTTVGFKSDQLKGTGRYVRVNVKNVINDHNKKAASWAAGLVEVQVYGKTNDSGSGSSSSENTSSGTSSSSSSSSSASNEASVSSDTTVASGSESSLSESSSKASDASTGKLPATGETVTVLAVLSGLTVLAGAGAWFLTKRH
ncbi:discoidin domain-containing protein [Lacticaseibacillus styriensis]|uniref:Family 43 glycosylhydrolase n=2 Tax=Lacticaseibacillus TaxID=2759736 RepID=A0AAN1EXQ8_LACCA|nr:MULTISPECIES: discoidin domain-containing protein [Lacticaseibacillus]ARY90478.1 hypothetical protein BGL52_01365 [Lacticaseibacillus casei]WLV81098.1 discoidin domain-containing protein [Lacticaseibacillus sp. NCIMB 15473]